MSGAEEVQGVVRRSRRRPIDTRTTKQVAEAVLADLTSGERRAILWMPETQHIFWPSKADHGAPSVGVINKLRARNLMLGGYGRGVVVTTLGLAIRAALAQPAAGGDGDGR